MALCLVYVSFSGFIFRTVDYIENKVLANPTGYWLLLDNPTFGLNIFI